VVEVTSGAFNKEGILPVGDLYEAMPMGMNMMEWSCLDFDYGGKEFLNEKGLNPLNMHYLGGIPQAGFYLNSTKEVKSLEDCQGLKISCFGSFAALAEKLGMSINYVPFPEQYVAQSTGVIEGACQLYNSIISMSFYEPAKFTLHPPLLGYLGAVAVVNLDAYNELPDDLRELVDVTYETLAFQFARDQTAGTKFAMSEFVEYGGTINYLPDEDIAVMKEKAVEVWEVLGARDPVCAEFLAMYKDFMVKLGYELPG